MEKCMQLIRELPTPQALKQQFPLDPSVAPIKEKRDAEIADIFSGKSNKFLLIIGPCSADNEDAVLDYMNRLARVYQKIQDKIFIIPRVYTNTPRTTGLGYKGMLHQPDPEGKEDMLAGIIAIVKCMPEWYGKPALPARKRCCIRRTTVICRICCPM